MKKHIREAKEAIEEVAAKFGATVEHFRRGKHEFKTVIKLGDDRHVIGLPGTPNCKYWTVVVARKQALQACKRMTAKPGPDLES